MLRFLKKTLRFFFKKSMWNYHQDFQSFFIRNKKMASKIFLNVLQIVESLSKYSSRTPKNYLNSRISQDISI